MTTDTILGDDPLWYKDAVIYELHVRAFHDSDGDGIGDLRGMTEKLDYLQDLGVTAIWILPFYPSPLRDDGYDIADYEGIHPDYGTMRQFRRFLDEAHARGLRVITELVINHTSDQHPWFQRAIAAPAGSPERDFYVWSEDPDRWDEARIIFQDTEHSNWAWSHEAQSHYWHRFFSHQPDLNFDNPAVLDAVKDALDYWADMGVDGMRLDAIPYLVERDGTNGENLPETHEVLKNLRKHLDANHPNRMFLAEANQWPEDAAEYFGDGDECHMNFHFPLMPRLFMSVRMEDRFPIIDILQQTPELPENCQWAVFLRNHDELTLEMVTDEERDYMYRSYAHDPRMRINLGIRRRLAPLLDNDRRLIELLNALLFSLPGTPVLYYGDEIGMGDNIYLGDRNGVRTPMQWSADRNAGFSRANPQKLYLPPIIDPEYHFETVNVEAQQNNPSSLLWWMKRLIALRKQHQVFGRGTIEFLTPENGKVLAFVREYEDERVLVVANLSRHVQAVELDLSDYRGVIPVEMFGRTPFPQVGDQPYFMTIGPHGFYWFAIDGTGEAMTSGYRSHAGDGRGIPIEDLPLLRTTGSWQDLVTGRVSASTERGLQRVLASRRWFGGKARVVQRVAVAGSLPVTAESETFELLTLKVDYVAGESEIYALALGFAQHERSTRIIEQSPGSVLAHASTSDGDGILFDAMYDSAFASALMETIRDESTLEARRGPDLAGSRTSALTVEDGPWDTQVLRGEQSNTSVTFGDDWILKLYRRIESGTNPDLEIGRFLTEQDEFTHTPAVAGALELTGDDGVSTLAVLQGYEPSEGDAWSYTLNVLERYFEEALSHDGHERMSPGPRSSYLALARRKIPPTGYDVVGPYLETADLLGQRTAELHVALADAGEGRERNEAFTPEAFTSLYQRSLYQSMRTLTRKTFQLLKERLAGPVGLENDTELARGILARESEVLERFRQLTAARIEVPRIRVHGDYHLGQVLYTGRDFVILDFEGEPARPLSERRLKRSPLRDVAGMLRSFHYATSVGMAEQEERGLISAPEHRRHLDLAGRTWNTWVSAAFLRSYLSVARPEGLVPADPDELEMLLGAYVMEKAIYELRYELNNRPQWVGIPLRGLQYLLDSDA